MMSVKINKLTLIELLVIIAIISILIAILLPSLNMAKQVAYDVTCLSNHKQLGSAAQIYAADYRGYAGFWWRPPNPDPTKPPLSPYRGKWWKYNVGSPWQDYFPITKDPCPILKCPATSSSDEPNNNSDINISWHWNASCDDYQASDGSLITRGSLQAQLGFGRKLENMTLFADGYSKYHEVWIEKNNKTAYFSRYRHFGKQFNSVFLDGHASSIPCTAHPTSGKRDWTNAIGWPGH